LKFNKLIGRKTFLTKLFITFRKQDYKNNLLFPLSQNINLVRLSTGSAILEIVQLLDIHAGILAITVMTGDLPRQYEHLLQVLI